MQVLITTDSCHVHREVARTMPILRRYSKAKLNDDQVKTMGTVLDAYTEYAHLNYMLRYTRINLVTCIHIIFLNYYILN